jgi:hypothetical protein
MCARVCAQRSLRFRGLGLSSTLRTDVGQAPSRGSGQTYDHYEHRDEMLAALEQWSDYVEQLVRPEAWRWNASNEESQNGNDRTINPSPW